MISLKHLSPAHAELGLPRLLGTWTADGDHIVNANVAGKQLLKAALNGDTQAEVKATVDQQLITTDPDVLANLYLEKSTFNDTDFRTKAMKIQDDLGGVRLAAQMSDVTDDKVLELAHAFSTTSVDANYQMLKQIIAKAVEVGRVQGKQELQNEIQSAHTSIETENA
jgi:hypothetical protein